jgi:hypothetical protein
MEADMARIKSGRKTSREVDKARTMSCRIRASEEVKAREREREGRKEGRKHRASLLPWKLDQKTDQGRRLGR